MKVVSYQNWVQNYKDFIYIIVYCWVDTDSFQYREFSEENGDKILRKTRNQSPAYIRKMDIQRKYLTFRVIPNIDSTGVVLSEYVVVVQLYKYF